MQAGLKDLLEKRRNRSIAIILGVKEREVDPHLRTLNPDAANKLRKVVLDQINELHEFVVDVLDSLDTGDVHLNDAYLEKLDMMHRDVGTLVRLVGELEVR